MKSPSLDVLLVSTFPTDASGLLVRSWLPRRRGLDHTNDRTTYAIQSPRGGGMVCAAGALEGSLEGRRRRNGPSTEWIGSSGALSTVGRQDDVSGFGPVPRLGSPNLCRCGDRRKSGWSGRNCTWHHHAPSENSRVQLHGRHQRDLRRDSRELNRAGAETAFVRRALHGESVTAAHLEHARQRLECETGWPHWVVSALVAGVAAVRGAAGRSAHSAATTGPIMTVDLAAPRLLKRTEDSRAESVQPTVGGLV